MEKYNIKNSLHFNQTLREYLPAGRYHNYAKPDNEIPIYFVDGCGSRLQDADGNQYLDFYCKCGAVFLGHKNAALSTTIEKVLNNYPITDYTDIDEIVCRYFVKYVPCCEKIRFCLSGTEAIQNAIRLARAYTSKNRVIKFEGHFHGSADNIMGGMAKNTQYPIVCEDVDNVFYTEGRANGIMQEQMLMLPWNDSDIVKEILCTYGNEVAAIIMEPVNMNGGSIMPAEGYLNEIREMCNEHHVLLIFDEVITGVHMGLGGAQSVYQVIPDLCVMGKAITSGVVPVSVLMGKAEIMNLMEQNKVAFGGTFNGYHLGMAAVKATFQMLSGSKGDIYYKNIESYSTSLRLIMEEEGERCGLPIVTQGPSGCFSFHCTDKELVSYNQYNDTILKRDQILRQCLLQFGIYVCRTSRMYLNISLTEEDITFFRMHIHPAFENARKIFDRLKL